MQGCFCQNFVQIFFTNYENFLPKNGKKENMQGALIFHVIYFASTHYRVKRSASHVISSFLAIFVPKKSSFAKIWQSSNQNNFAQFFGTRCTRTRASTICRNVDMFGILQDNDNSL